VEPQESQRFADISVGRPRGQINHIWASRPISEIKPTAMHIGGSARDCRRSWQSRYATRIALCGPH
jgi:hypothetical protein